MLQNIQILRVVAAYLVVFHHAQPNIDFNGKAMETHIGTFGVDIFFVISGFIMVFISARREQSTIRFWKDRIIRIAPLYWLATFCMVALASAGFNPSGLHGWDAVSLSTSLFFLPTARPDGNYYPILTPGWTLIYEMFFYFLFGLSLWLRNQLHAVLAITTIFLGLWIAGRIFGPISFAVDYYMNPLMLEFVFGCFLGLLYTRSNYFLRRHPKTIAMLLVASGMSIIIMSDILLHGLFLRVPEVRLVVFGVPAVFIVLAMLILEQSGHHYSGNFLLMQGAASYAIYLFHPLLLQSTFKVAGKVEAVGISASVSFVTLLAFAIVCLGGTLVHLWIEKPLSQVLRGN